MKIDQPLTWTIESSPIYEICDERPNLRCHPRLLTDSATPRLRLDSTAASHWPCLFCSRTLKGASAHVSFVLIPSLPYGPVAGTVRPNLIRIDDNVNCIAI